MVCNYLLRFKFAKKNHTEKNNTGKLNFPQKKISNNRIL